MSALELKPCAHCASEEVFTKSWGHENGETWWLARCSVCGCGTPEHCQSEEHAVATWNRRAPSLTPIGDREAIARIILGPQSSWNAGFKSDRLDPEWLFYPEVARAFAKADAILALGANAR